MQNGLNNTNTGLNYQEMNLNQQYFIASQNKKTGILKELLEKLGKKIEELDKEFVDQRKVIEVLKVTITKQDEVISTQNTQIQHLETWAKTNGGTVNQIGGTVNKMGEDLNRLVRHQEAGDLQFRQNLPHQDAGDLQFEQSIFQTLGNLMGEKTLETGNESRQGFASNNPQTKPRSPSQSRLQQSSHLNKSPQ